MMQTGKDVELHENVLYTAPSCGDDNELVQAELHDQTM